MTGLKVLTDSRGAPGAGFCPWMYGKPEQSYLLHLPALSLRPFILFFVALPLETPSGGCISLCFLPLILMLLTTPSFSSVCCLEQFVHNFPSFACCSILVSLAYHVAPTPLLQLYLLALRVVLCRWGAEGSWGAVVQRCFCIGVMPPACVANLEPTDVLPFAKSVRSKMNASCPAINVRTGYM